MSLTSTESDILNLVGSLTTTGLKSLDEQEMTKLKNICKSSPSYVKYTFDTLITQLRKEHSEIRYSALLVINELVTRSSVMRTLLESNIDEILENVVETDPEFPLPLPKGAAKDLKYKGLQFLKDWALKFGSKYKRLQVAYNYLKNVKQVNFDDLEARSAVENQHLCQQQEQRQRNIGGKVQRVKDEMKENVTDIENVLVQIENCFQLLVPHPTEFLADDSYREDFKGPKNVMEDVSSEQGEDGEAAFEMEDVFTEIDDALKTADDESYKVNEALRHHGIHNMKYSITVDTRNRTEVSLNEDTSPVIENLCDLYKLMTAKYVPLVKKWLEILIKGDGCMEELQKAIDLKQRLQASKEKYQELKVTPKFSQLVNKDGSDDEDEFVEVKEKEDYEDTVVMDDEDTVANYSRSSIVQNTEILSQPSCSKDTEFWKLKYSESDASDPTSAASTLNKLAQKFGSGLTEKKHEVNETELVGEKAERLKKAPVLPYDIDLYHWTEKNPVVPQYVKFDSLHNFWEFASNNDNDARLEQEKIAQLRTRSIEFTGTFTPVTRSCHAPLPNGKLCPRQDRYKCPFHGKIIDRDLQGNPTGGSSEAATSLSQSVVNDVPDWQDPELLKDIEGATGINLKLPEKRKSKSSETKNNPKNEQSLMGLTNLKAANTSVRQRITKKLQKRHKKYSQKLDEMEKKRYNDKFGDQWNYY